MDNEQNLECILEIEPAIIGLQQPTEIILIELLLNQMCQIKHHVLLRKILLKPHWVTHLIFREVITEPDLNPAQLVNPQHFTVDVEGAVLLEQQAEGDDGLHQHVNGLGHRELQVAQPMDMLGVGVGLVRAAGVALVEPVVEHTHERWVGVATKLVIVDVVRLLLLVVQVQHVDLDLLARIVIPEQAGGQLLPKIGIIRFGSTEISHS